MRRKSSLERGISAWPWAGMLPRCADGPSARDAGTELCAWRCGPCAAAHQDLHATPAAPESEFGPTTRRVPAPVRARRISVSDSTSTTLLDRHSLQPGFSRALASVMGIRTVARNEETGLK